MRLEGLEDIHRAACLLTDDALELRECLRQAGQAVWSAMFHQDSWPAPWQRRADALCRLLLIHGPIATTVARLDDTAADELYRALFQFVDDFLRACGGSERRPPPPKSISGDPEPPHRLRLRRA